MEREKNKR